MGLHWMIILFTLNVYNRLHDLLCKPVHTGRSRFMASLSPLKGFHLIASLAASLLRRDHYKRIDA